MAAAEITPENFIEVIQSMTESERKKITKADLIKLIMNAPVRKAEDLNTSNDSRVNDLFAAVEMIRSQSSTNAVEILNLKKSNEILTKENALLRQEQCGMLERIRESQEKIERQENHLNEIEQYLRANNIEIVGFNDLEDSDRDFEPHILSILNSLPEFQEKPITSRDIDICHPVPTERKDKKNVSVGEHFLDPFQELGPSNG